MKLNYSLFGLTVVSVVLVIVFSLQGIGYPINAMMLLPALIGTSIFVWINVEELEDYFGPNKFCNFLIEALGLPGALTLSIEKYFIRNPLPAVIFYLSNIVFVYIPFFTSIRQGDVLLQLFVDYPPVYFLTWMIQIYLGAVLILGLVVVAIRKDLAILIEKKEPLPLISYIDKNVSGLEGFMVAASFFSYLYYTGLFFVWILDIVFLWNLLVSQFTTGLF